MRSKTTDTITTSTTSVSYGTCAVPSARDPWSPAAGLASTAGYLSPDMGRSRLRQRVWPVEEAGLVRILDSSAAPPPAADVAGLVIGTWHPDPDSNATATGCLAVVRNARQTD